ncbi:MAG TPA: endonuclease domain-containing protein [Burkholderiales bacterium]|jgi:very-short-patch-repair endonuclease|nr:endonuclease domain-containing protein [Burkholderiales bacterium]
MTPRRPWIPYRRDLTSRAQALRRDPTPAEKKLWYEFLRDLPYKFTRQKPLGRYVADFYCSSQRLVIELDGDSHYTDEAQRYDERRTAALEVQGLRVARFTNMDVLQNFQEVCGVVLAMLSEKPKP